MINCSRCFDQNFLQLPCNLPETRFWKPQRPTGYCPYFDSTALIKSFNLSILQNLKINSAAIDIAFSIIPHGTIACRLSCRGCWSTICDGSYYIKTHGSVSCGPRSRRVTPVSILTRRKKTQFSHLRSSVLP